jgi:hypothetical protein
MDIVCTRCAEPWDICHVNEEAETFKFGASRGHIVRCPACGPRPTPPRNASAISALADVLGDDVDGLAAELEDWGLI